MKNFLVVLFTFVFNNLYSQRINSYKEYYETINQAELLIVGKKYNLALDQYKNVKKKYNYIYAKDKLNMALCFLEVGRLKRAKNIFFQLLKLGAQPEWLLKRPLIAQKLSNDKIWRKKVRPDIRISESLKDSLRRVFDLDQNIRLVKNAYAEHLSEVRSADSINFIILKKVIDDYGGLPDERLIGIDHESLIEFPYYIHIFHQTPGFKQFEYSSMLLDEIKKGNINPFVGANLFTHSSGLPAYFGPLGLTKIKYGQNNVVIPGQDTALDDGLKNSNIWLSPIYPDSLLTRLDSLRNSFFIDPIKDFERKALFQLTDDNFIFYSKYYLRTVFNFRTKEDAEKIIKFYRRIYL